MAHVQGVGKGLTSREIELLNSWFSYALVEYSRTHTSEDKRDRAISWLQFRASACRVDVRCAGTSELDRPSCSSQQDGEPCKADKFFITISSQAAQALSVLWRCMFGARLEPADVDSCSKSIQCPVYIHTSYTC